MQLEKEKDSPRRFPKLLKVVAEKVLCYYIVQKCGLESRRLIVVFYFAFSW
jgi:hypothetical protein